MIHFFGINEKNKLETKLETAIELEQDGYKKAALHLLSTLVQKNPDCEACRYHMGRLAFELKNGAKEESNIVVKK